MVNAKINTQKMCASALLIAASILLPQIFHIFGGTTAGGVFLPMHIPVFTSGLLLGPYYGIIVGVLSPIISFFLTGMPPAAKLPFMLIELASYGFLSGIFYTKKINLYLSLILSQIGGRVIYGFSLLIATYLLHLKVPAIITVGTAVLTGIPGIILQIVFVPSAILLLKRVIHFDRIHVESKKFTRK